MDRHEFLTGLHHEVQPRTYLEIGIRDGQSLTLSRASSIGIDPAFEISCPLGDDVELVRATSDDYFAVTNPTERFGGLPLDLSFIDGMHWAEFALRDFIYVESYTHPTGVVVFDDMLPRSVAEAARECHTFYWAGDVYKVTDVLKALRPDLVVLEVDTKPTGTVVVLLPDATSTVLAHAYPGLEPELTTADPQSVPDRVLFRQEAVDPAELLAEPWWATLVAERSGDLPAGSLVRALSVSGLGPSRAIGAAPRGAAARS